MVIEALYPEMCCLYGDMANIRYLQLCLPDARFVYTAFTEKPHFAEHDVDMLYLGCMSETAVTQVIEKLMPYKNRLKALIDNNKTVLFTGNAISVLGEKIICGNEEIQALGLYPHYTKRFMDDRHNSMFYGVWNDIEIAGCKSQFDFYYNVPEHSFIKVAVGTGNNPDDKYEGLNDKNLYATALLGPFLILNPPFTQKMLKGMGSTAPLAFEKEVFEAYQYRLKEGSYLIDEKGVGNLPKV